MIQRGKALDEADRAFLRKVRGYYEDWPLEPNPVAALKFRASGLSRVGTIFFAIDQYGEARSSREAAIRTYEAVLRLGPIDPVVVNERSAEMQKLHTILERMNDPVAGEAVARKLIAALEPRARESPAHRRDLAAYSILLAGDLAKQRRFKEAEVYYLSSLAGLEKLRQENPRDPSILSRELNAYFASALRAMTAGWRDIAEARYRKMSALAEAALGTFPGDPGFTRQRILGLGGIVSLLQEDRPAEALEIHRRKVALARDLVARFPENLPYHNDVLFGAYQTFLLCSSLGRPGDAEADLKLAVEDGTRLVEAEPAVFDRARSLTAVLMASAALFEATDRPRQAIEYYDRMVATFSPWTKLSGRSVEVLPFMIHANRNSARLLAKLGDHAGAAHRLAALLDFCESKDRPGICLELAKERLAAGDHPGARAAAEQASASPDTAAAGAELLATLAAKSEGR